LERVTETVGASPSGEAGRESVRDPAAELRAELTAVARAEHGEVFRLLGPHAVEREGGRRILVRTIQPYASSVSIVIGDETIRAERVELGPDAFSRRCCRRDTNTRRRAITGCASSGLTEASAKWRMRTLFLPC